MIDILYWFYTCEVLLFRKQHVKVLAHPMLECSYTIWDPDLQQILLLYTPPPVYYVVETFTLHMAAGSHVKLLQAMLYNIMVYIISSSPISVASKAKLQHREPLNTLSKECIDG
jgi:hypothetical protein